VTPQDMSQHAQICFSPLIAFFPTKVDKLLKASRMILINAKCYKESVTFLDMFEVHTHKDITV